MRYFASIAVMFSLLLGGAPYEVAAFHVHYHAHGEAESGHVHHHAHQEAPRHNDTPAEASSNGADVIGIPYLIADGAEHGHTHAVGSASDLQSTKSFRRSKLTSPPLAVASRTRDLGCLTSRVPAIPVHRDCIDSRAISTDLLASVVLLL